MNGSPSYSIGLTGSSFTFDAGIAANLPNPDNSITGFSFVSAPTLSIAVGNVPGVTTVQFGSVTVTMGSPFSSNAFPTGPNTWGFSMGRIAASGTVSVNGGAFTPFSGSTTAAAGSINLGTGTIEVKQITIGSIAGLFLVKGDFVFHGVPEPGTFALLAAGAIALAGAHRRRSS